MKWIGKGVLMGSKSRKAYYYGEEVDPADISKDRLEELLESKQLSDVTPEEIVEANQKKLANKPVPAADVIASISNVADLGELSHLMEGEKRPSVVKAAKAKAEALEAAAKLVGAEGEGATGEGKAGSDDGSEGNEPAEGATGEGEAGPK